jgi:hypothetical protein
MIDVPSHTAKLPLGYMVRFSWDGTLNAEWLPDVPDIRSPRMQRKLLVAYQAARAEFLQILATAIGSNVMVMDETSGAVVQPANKH